MTDLLSETVIDLADVPSVLPSRNGKRLHISCIHRWRHPGIKARSGERIQLECRRIGGRIITSKEAIARFCAALEAADLAHRQAKAVVAPTIQAPPAPRQPKARASAIARAESRLAEAGV